VNPGSEQLLGVIPNTNKRKGLFGMEAFNVIVTSQRLIFAQLTADMIKAAAADETKRAKEEGKGGIATFFNTAFAGYSVYKKYFDMDMASILSENKGNFEVGISEIKRYQLTGGAHHHDRQQNQHMLRLSTTTHGEITLMLQHSDVDNARQLLQRVLS
jgi:hypothetical protein